MTQHRGFEHDHRGSSIDRVLIKVPANVKWKTSATGEPGKSPAMRAFASCPSSVLWSGSRHLVTPVVVADGLYAHDLFTAERGEAVICLPVADPPTTGRVQPFVVPAQDLAIVVHSGPHGDIDVSYAALGRYVTENEIAVEGPVHERYLVGPSDTDESSAWSTEIGWPVFHTSLG